MNRRRPTTFHLTDGFVEALKSERGKQTDYYDDKLAGFGLRVSPGGAKLFFLLYRSAADGKNKRAGCGRADKNVKVDAARKQARAILTGIDKGQEPQRKTGGPTFNDFVNRYVKQHARKHKKTALQDEQRLARHIPQAWYARQLTTTSRNDIEELHTEIGERKKVEANRLKSLIHLMFQLARGWGMIAGENPCAGIARYKEMKRKRFVQPDEMPRLNLSPQAERDWRWAAFIKLSLLFGTRRGNLLALAWSQINFQNRTLTIDGLEMKSGEAHTITISPQAMDILTQLPSFRVSTWVFPAGRIGRLDLERHLSSPGRAWARILKRAGLSDEPRERRLTIHSMRHTIASWAADSNYSLPIIGRALGHKSERSTAIYVNLQTDPVRVLMEQVGDAMMSAMEASAITPVIPALALPASAAPEVAAAG